MLVVFLKTCDGDAYPQLILYRFADGMHLSKTAIGDGQIRHLSSFVNQVLVPSPYYLAHRPVVVGSLNCLDLKPFIVALAWLRHPEDHTSGYRVRALYIGVIETIDPPRQGRESHHLLQLRQDPHSSLLGVQLVVLFEPVHLVLPHILHCQIQQLLFVPRGTFTHANPDFLKDIQAMLDLGFTELSMEPVVCAPEDPSALTEEDKPIVMEQYEKLAELMLQRRREGRPFTFYHYMIDLKGGPCIYKRISGCGSGTEYMAVTPWGDLYPCHQFVGEEKFKLGDIWSGVTNTAVRDEFAACNVYARPECRDCWARLYCSGGCAANAYHATGKITGTYAYGCDLFRKRMECALMLAAVNQLEGAQ